MRIIQAENSSSTHKRWYLPSIICRILWSWIIIVVSSDVGTAKTQTPPDWITDLSDWRTCQKLHFLRLRLKFKHFVAYANNEDPGKPLNYSCTVFLSTEYGWHGENVQREKGLVSVCDKKTILAVLQMIYRSIGLINRMHVIPWTKT